MDEKSLNAKIDNLKKQLKALRAEARLTGEIENPELIENSVLVHELKVHQIELEMQNQMLQTSQQQLAISNERYQMLFNQAPIGLVIVDKSAIIRKVNSTLLDMLGLKYENVLNTPFSYLLSPEDSNIFNSRFRAIFKNPKEKEITLRILRSNGAMLFVKITGSLIDDGNENDVQQLQLSITDISRQKETENSLIEEKNFSELVVNTVSSGIFTVDDNNAITSWNKSAELITGYRSDEVVGRPCIFKDNCDGVCIFEFNKSFIPHKNKDYLFKTKDGREILISKSVEFLRDYEGEIIGGFENFRDITAQRSTEKALEKSRDFIDAIADSYPALLYIYDMELRKNIWANTAHKQYFKKYYADKESMDQEAVKDIIHPDDYKKLQERTVDLVENPERKKIVTEVRIKKDGGWIYMSHHMSPFMEDSDGKVQKIIGALFDISEQKKAEEALALALNENKDLLAEKETILKEVHHRIKNNMATIESLLNLHLAKLENENAREAIKEAAGRVISMRLLYEKLFNTDQFSDIDSKEYLSALIDEILSVFSDHNVKVKKNLKSFKMDARLIFPVGIIINELITNIMKYAYSPGEAGTVQITAVETDSKVEIIIHDNGRGLPEDFNIEESNSFGLELVGLLTGQIGGNIDFYNKDGTKVILSFTVE